MKIMANCKQHAVTGALAGLAATVLVNLIEQRIRRSKNPQVPFNWAELLLKAGVGAGAGVFFGVLPDILEPATSPNHRKFFHSGTAALAVIAGLAKIKEDDVPTDNKALALAVGVGYLSHLMLDSQTPMGLPLVA